MLLLSLHPIIVCRWTNLPLLYMSVYVLCIYVCVYVCMYCTVRMYAVKCNNKNSALSPLSLSVCSFWLSQNTTTHIISLYTSNCNSLVLWPTQIVSTARYELCLEMDFSWIHFFRLWLLAGLSTRRSRFDPRWVRVRPLVDTVALVQNFLRLLRFCPVSVIPSMLNIHIHVHGAPGRRTNDRSLRAFQKSVYFANQRALDRKLLSRSIRMQRIFLGISEPSSKCSDGSQVWRCFCIIFI